MTAITEADGEASGSPPSPIRELRNLPAIFLTVGSEKISLQWEWQNYGHRLLAMPDHQLQTVTQLAGLLANSRKRATEWKRSGSVGEVLQTLDPAVVERGIEFPLDPEVEKQLHARLRQGEIDRFDRSSYDETLIVAPGISWEIIKDSTTNEFIQLCRAEIKQGAVLLEILPPDLSLRPLEPNQVEVRFHRPPYSRRRSESDGRQWGKTYGTTRWEERSFILNVSKPVVMLREDIIDSVLEPISVG